MLCDPSSNETPSRARRAPDNIDLGRLARDVAAAAAESAALKRVLRARWTRPMADEQRRLCSVRRRITELLVLVARCRGRHHLAAPPHDIRQSGAAWDREAWHARIADRVALDYARPEAAERAT
jgi:hypothetical protein